MPPAERELPPWDGAASSIELVVLGSGNAFARGRYWSSLLLDRQVLLDASPVTVPHLHKLGIDLTQLTQVLISHLHGDHFFGLPFLLLEYMYLVDQTHPLEIVGPHGLRERVTAAAKLAFPNSMESRGDRLQLEFVEVAHAGEVATASGPVTAVPMVHGNNTAYGYRLKTPSGSAIAYTGDTEYHEGLYTLADGADLLIIECSSAEAPVEGHMYPETLRRLRENLPDETQILVTHLQHANIDIAGVHFVEDFERIVC